jgi:hypothetical protein
MGSSQQRRLTVLILRVNPGIHPKQQLDYSLMPVFGSTRQQRVTVTILRFDVGTSLEQ